MKTKKISRVNKHIVFTGVLIAFFMCAIIILGQMCLPTVLVVADDGESSVFIENSALPYAKIENGTRKVGNEKSIVGVNALMPLAATSAIIIPKKAILVITILAIVIGVEIIIIALLFIKRKKKFKARLPKEESEKLIESEQIEIEQEDKTEAVKVAFEETIADKAEIIEEPSLKTSMDITEVIEEPPLETSMDITEVIEEHSLETSMDKTEVIEEHSLETSMDKTGVAEAAFEETIADKAEIIKEPSLETSLDKTKVAKTAFVETIVDKIPEGRMTPTGVDAVQEDPTMFRRIYNYSYKARLHLADAVTLERYAELKNHILSYEGVRISGSWGYERFMYRGKSVLKIRANVKSLKVFFNLNASDFEGTKYRLYDVSNIKAHASTPSKYMVNGPRKLTYAKDLVDKYMQACNAARKQDFTEESYVTPSLSKDVLVEMQLIKVDTISKTYSDIVYS